MGINCPDNPYELHSVLSLLMSAKAGKPVGRGEQKLISIAHTVFQNYKQHLFVFGKLLQRYGNDKILLFEDTSNKWSEKISAIREGLKIRHQQKYLTGQSHEFSQDIRYYELFSLIFPEIKEDIVSEIAKYQID